MKTPAIMLCQRPPSQSLDNLAKTDILPLTLGEMLLRSISVFPALKDEIKY